MGMEEKRGLALHWPLHTIQPLPRRLPWVRHRISRFRWLLGIRAGLHELRAWTPRRRSWRGTPLDGGLSHKLRIGTRLRNPEDHQVRSLVPEGSAGPCTVHYEGVQRRNTI